jgi:GNAT superfamily N-acetyltransferase
MMQKIQIQPYGVYQEAEMISLYRSVGWTNYTDRPEMLEAAYRNSLCILGAYDGDKLVGVIRAVGDGVSIVFVQDLLVLPAYQRQGIGTRLLQAILERYSDVYQIELLTDNTAKTNAFYESLGMTRADRLGCCAYTKMNPLS